MNIQMELKKGVDSLDSEGLYKAFVSGAREIINNKDSLNSINVFPVADGDTGNNLASTMSFMIEETRLLKSAKNTMNSMADAVLTGARGNSGIIFAQYINGISINLADEEEVTIGTFAESVQKAFPHAYNAISNPVEGTIITVIRDWAQAVYSQKDNAKTFYDLLAHPLIVAFKSLEETPSKLQILKDSKVVDSGAKAFVHFIEGFTEFIKTGKAKDMDIQLIDTPIFDFPLVESSSTDHRYCTEVLIKFKDNNMDSIKAELQDLGDSLIVAGNLNKARIHIHTNYPDRVLKILRKNGTILHQKADDMKRQYESLYERKYKIALVTDSIADLPSDIMDKYQINLLPLNIIMEGTSYLDKVTMTPEAFYELLDDIKEYPSSSMPSQKIVEGLLSSLLKNYDEVLVITVAKVQSRTNDIVNKAAENVKSLGKRIEVIDSRQNSGAEGLLVMKAAELIHKGTSLDDIIKEIEKLRSQTKILVSLDTLKYMVKSGRLNKATGFAGKLLNLKPVVSLDEMGKGIIEEKAFSIKSNTNKILKTLEKTSTEKGITRYAILHANNPSRAEDFRNQCLEILGMEPEYIMNISTIVGMSAGVGTVAVSYMCEGSDLNG